MQIGDLLQLDISPKIKLSEADLRLKGTLIEKFAAYAKKNPIKQAGKRQKFLAELMINEGLNETKNLTENYSDQDSSIHKALSEGVYTNYTDRVVFILNKLAHLEKLIQAYEHRPKEVIELDPINIPSIVEKLKNSDASSIMNIITTDQFYLSDTAVKSCEKLIKKGKQRNFRKLIHSSIKHTIEASAEQFPAHLREPIKESLAEIEAYNNNATILKKKGKKEEFKLPLKGTNDMICAKAKIILQKTSVKAIYQLIVAKEYELQKYPDVISQSRFQNGRLEEQKKSDIKLNEITHDITISNLTQPYNLQQQAIYSNASGFEENLVKSLSGFTKALDAHEQWKNKIDSVPPSDKTMVVKLTTSGFFSANTKRTDKDKEEKKVQGMSVEKVLQRFKI